MQGWASIAAGSSLSSPIIASPNGTTLAAGQSRPAMVPHLSHSDPWAHHFICCDIPHAASTSTTPPNSSTAPSPFATPFMSPAIGQHAGGGVFEEGQGIAQPFPIRLDLDFGHSSSSLSEHRHTSQPLSFDNVPAGQAVGPIGATVALERMDRSAGAGEHGTACVEGAYGCDQADCSGADVCQGSTACSVVECCADPDCDVACDADNCHEDHPPAVDGCDECADAGEGISGEAALAEWACSKEGCKAIEQYLQCCTLPNCDLPVVTPPADAVGTSATHYHLPQSAIPSPIVAPAPPTWPWTTPSSLGNSPATLPTVPQPQPHSHHGHDANTHPAMRAHHGASHTHASHSAHHSHSVTEAFPPHTFQQAVHVCHWQNCHLAFRSMPDLLAHVASDHLNAPGFSATAGSVLGKASPEAVEQGHRGSEQASSGQQSNAADGGLPGSSESSTSLPLGLFGHQHSVQGLSIPQSVERSSQVQSQADSLPQAAAVAPQRQQMFEQSTSQQTGMPDMGAFPFTFDALTANLQNADPLLSCLWDDCIPLQDCCATEDPACPPHPLQHGHQQVASQQQTGHAFQSNGPVANGGGPSAGQAAGSHHVQDHTMAGIQPHSHSHAHGHSHTHNAVTGEPFSPQTMLRHVLEEHLGVTPELLFGDMAGKSPLQPVAPPIHTPLVPGSAHAAAISRAHAALHHNHAHGHHHHHAVPLLLTPPSSSSSSPPPAGKPLVCQWPGCTHTAAFPTAGSLMDHLAEDHIGRGKDSYACLWGECAAAGGDGTHPAGRVFRSRQKVLRHLQSHTGYRPFVCEVCEQAFSEAAPLAAHMRRHAQEKPFVCDHPGCGKRFAISSSLTIHMRTHNGEKPFVCPHCSKGFVEASNLTKHIRTHTGERPFACPHPGCGKRFPRPDQLKRHMGIHDREAKKKADKKIGHG